jgi:glycosyltransferase involved in cell wall biosynthesis
VQAAAMLLPRFPRLRLLLAGEGARRALLERQIADLGLTAHVTLLGDRDDIPDILRTIDVYAMPSLCEGVGRALTEAMYMARPIVATAVNGVTELIRHDVTGLLVPPREPAALAAAIARLVTDRALARRLGEAARGAVAERMDVAHMIARLERLYLSILPASAVLASPPAARSSSAA